MTPSHPTHVFAVLTALRVAALNAPSAVPHVTFSALVPAAPAAHTATQGYRTYYTVEASKMEPVFDEFMTHLYQDDPSELEPARFPAMSRDVGE